MPDKVPAFQFYPRDFLTDEEVRLMSHTERGIYITLLCLCWLHETLPGDPLLIAKLVGVPSKRFVKLWNGPIGAKFQLIDGRYRQKRLDRERQKQEEWRLKSAEGGRRSADGRARVIEPPLPPTGNQDPSGPVEPPLQPKSNTAFALCSLQSASAEDQERSSALPAATEPPILVYPTHGKTSEWGLTPTKIAEWRELYPTLDVLAECRKALAYVQAGNKKTAGGMPKFLVGWLNRATNWARAPAGAARVEQIRRTTVERDTGGLAEWAKECARIHNGKCFNEEQHTTLMREAS